MFDDDEYGGPDESTNPFNADVSPWAQTQSPLIGRRRPPTQFQWNGDRDRFETIPAPAAPAAPTGDDDATLGVPWGGGGGGGGGDIGPLRFNFPGAPTFRATPFNAPSVDEALNEPGYQFRLGQGQEALERSAAARGVLRTGGTLKDLIQYGQNFGAQEYNNVFGRSLQAYDRRYQGERDAFAPRLAEWQNRVAAERARALAEFEVANRSRGGGGGSNLGDLLTWLQVAGNEPQRPMPGGRQ